MTAATPRDRPPALDAWHMSDAQWEVALGVLRDGGRCADLWTLALAASPRWSARIVRLLADMGWQPPLHADRGPFAKLAAMAKNCGEDARSHEPFGISALAITPDGKLLVSAGGGRLRLWSLPGGRPLAVLRGSWPLAITPDGSILASGWHDGTVRLSSLPEGEPMSTLEGHTARVRALAVTPDGSLLATADGQTVRVWTLPDGRPLTTLNSSERSWGSFAALAFTPDGALVSAGNDRIARLCSLAGDRPMTTLNDNVMLTGSVFALAITPDGSLLSGDHYNSVVLLSSLPDGRSLARLSGHSNGISAIRVTPDGSLVASGGGDRTVRLWSLPDGRACAILRGHTGPVTSLAIAPDGTVLFSASSDGVLLWSLPDGRPLARLDGHAVDVAAPPVAPRGPLPASTGRDVDDDTATLWVAEPDRLWRSQLDRRWLWWEQNRNPNVWDEVDIDPDWPDNWLETVDQRHVPDRERARAQFILMRDRFSRHRRRDDVEFDADPSDYLAVGDFDIHITAYVPPF